MQKVLSPFRARATARQPWHFALPRAAVIIDSGAAPFLWGRHSCLPLKPLNTQADKNVCPTKTSRFHKFGGEPRFLGNAPSRRELKDPKRMSIKFKCPHCKKPLAVKDNLAGKRAACPACKKPILIPAPVAAPADLEAFAAAALIEQPAAPKDDKPTEFVELDCPMCGDSIKMPVELAGKNGQCPACKNIIKVPLPKADKPKDWRDIDKKGPTAAIVNLPEQLDDAWGTELKGRVSREALEDAGAIQIEIEPVGWGGWIKRGLIAAAVVGFVSLIFFGIKNSRAAKVEKDVFGEVWEHKKKLDEEKDPKKRLHPVLVATIHWAEGVRLLQQDKGDKAREKFTAARGCIGSDIPKDMIVDADLFLIELAWTQIDLGGTEDQFRTKARIEWDKGDKNVLKEVTQTLNRIRSPEARVIAVRELSSELITRKKKELAISLASGQSAQEEKGGASPVLVQLTALVFAHGDVKRFANLIKPPDPKIPLDLSVRLAYAEGHARKGEWEEAKKFADHAGRIPDRLETNIGVACVLLTDKTNKEAALQAGQFVDKALELTKGQKLNPWLTLQLCKAAYRFPDHAARAKELADKLPPNFKRRAQLEWLLAQLEKSDAKAEDLVKALPEHDGPTRGLAWVALGRHFGSALALPEVNSEDGPYRVFAKIGQALGNKEPAK